MFNQLACTHAIFLFVVNGEPWSDGGQRGIGPFGGRNNVVYHPEGGGEFGAGVHWDQRRRGIGQDHEQLPAGFGRKLLELAHMPGTENFQMSDEGDRRRPAAARLFGEIARPIEGDDFVTGIQTQLYN